MFNTINYLVNFALLLLTLYIYITFVKTQDESALNHESSISLNHTPTEAFDFYDGQTSANSKSMDEQQQQSETTNHGDDTLFRVYIFLSSFIECIISLIFSCLLK